jgi:hypothetical protein
MKRICALAFTLVGCATSGSSVEVQGGDVDISLMAGRWEGTYEGIESGRKGTVNLDLTAGYHFAEGKVVMNAADPARAQPLTIKFVEIGGRQLKGKIEPYTDPGCKCTVDTEFVGQVQGDTMRGTFTTQPVGGTQKQSGRWIAQRQR